MATTTPQGPDLTELEERAAEHLGEEGLTSLETPFIEDAGQELKLPVLRLGIVVSFAVLAAAVMTAGVFVGTSPLFYAGISGVLGVAIGIQASQVRKSALAFTMIGVGIFLVGIVMMIPTGSVFAIGVAVKEAVKEGNIRRPPVNFIPGWHAIIGWMMAGLGFISAWVAAELKKPALALLVPLPIVALTAISVPDQGSPSAQVLSGVACLILFAISMGLLSGTQVEVGPDEQRPSMAYEVRRAMRALPLIGVISAALLFLPNFLFPPPLYDPTQEAKKPQTVPITKVPDKVLFKVKSNVKGPWRTGGLDVYDTKDFYWKLPPFAASKLAPIRKSGVVDSELQPGTLAEIEIAGLEGAVLPGLPNLVGLVAKGPKFAYDDRSANIRLAAGTIKQGLKYKVVAASIPTVEELRIVGQDVTQIDCTQGVKCSEYLVVPPMPPSVQELINKSGAANAWDRLDYLRSNFLKTVIATGQGTPKAVPPERVEDMLVGTKEGTPYEIVAAQAMLARWAGVPSRIGYGYDGGDKKDDGILEVRPKHGSSFLEVYFPTYKWLPVIGTPLQAKSSLGNEPQQFNDDVAASEDIAVKVFVPIALDPKSYLYAQIRHVLSIILPIVLLLLILFYSYPAAKKAWIRSRRRAWGSGQDAKTRIALAYADWRDVATDFGYRFDSDTPLMFLDRVIEDEEHTQFAWLVTRSLWGDLQGSVSEQDGLAAEEMSKSLRKRLGQAHNSTLRFVAAVSRLSLRHPYAPLLGIESKEPKDVPKAA